MADDRIYMQCNICGKKLYLGKQFGWQPFYWESYDGRTLEEKLNEFFEEHYHPEQDAYMWNGNFSIVYESDNDGHLDEIWRTPPAETEEETQHKWNNHAVACLLAELFDDTCACNYNDIDEWLPEKCELLAACPNPGGVACWEQFLKHRKEVNG